MKGLENIEILGGLKSGNDIHSSIGLNFKYTDLQAVLGISAAFSNQRKSSEKKRGF